MILVIGNSSKLGAALVAYLHQSENDFVATTNQASPAQGLFHLDLGCDKNWPEFPNSITSVFISAALTSQEYVRNHFDRAYHINVTQTKKLIQRFDAIGIHTVFPSTNLVLANQTPMQGINSARKPSSVYANFKAEVEEFIEADCSNTCILRLPKVLDASTPLVKNWITALTNGDEIEAFYDLVIAPVSTQYTIKVLSKIHAAKSKGIMHLSGDQDLSYFDFAKKLCAHLNYPETLVKPASVSQIGLKSSEQPKFASLDCKETEKAIGIGHQKLDDFLADL